MNLVSTATFLTAFLGAIHCHEGHIDLDEGHSELQVPPTQVKCTDQYWAFNGSADIPSGLTVDYNSANARIQDGVLNLILNKELGGTRISVDQLFHYGTVDATLQIAPGSNVITAFILMAENGDEIDFEFVGKDTNVIQTNYFYKGKPIYNIHAMYFGVNRNLTSTFNRYTIHWTPEYYEWRVNGRTLRKLFKNETIEYPETPSSIQIGIWNAEPSKWAGLGVDWNDAPFAVRVSSIKVTCYNKDRDIIVPPISIPDYCKNLYGGGDELNLKNLKK